MQSAPVHDAAFDVERARQLRDNELESAKTTAKNWRYFAWSIFVLLVGVFVWHIVSELRREEHFSYVEIDIAKRQVRIIEPAKERYEPSQDVAEWFLGMYLTTLRSVPTDVPLMEKNWEQLRTCMTPKGAALLKQYEADEQPTKQRSPRDVEPGTFIQRTPRSYDVRWVERQYKANGDLNTTTFWSGTFTFERRDPRTTQEKAHCPAGIFLEHWARAKDR